jgi:hypothetical protein
MELSWVSFSGDRGDKAYFAERSVFALPEGDEMQVELSIGKTLKVSPRYKP